MLNDYILHHHHHHHHHQNIAIVDASPPPNDSLSHSLDCRTIKDISYPTWHHCCITCYAKRKHESGLQLSVGFSKGYGCADCIRGSNPLQPIDSNSACLWHLSLWCRGGGFPHTAGWWGKANCFYIKNINQGRDQLCLTKTRGSEHCVQSQKISTILRTVWKEVYALNLPLTSHDHTWTVHRNTISCCIPTEDVGVTVVRTLIWHQVSQVRLSLQCRLVIQTVTSCHKSNTVNIFYITEVGKAPVSAV